MEFDVTAYTGSINFAPANVYEEVYQNVRTLIGTPKYSVPLDRSLGIDPDVVDMPTHRAQAKMTSEIFKAIRKYEKRCKVVRVTYDADLDGKLVPAVRIRIGEEAVT